MTGTPVDELIAERIGIPYESLTQEAVEEYQLQALRRTVRYAKEHGDFYRELLSDIDPDSIRSPEDLQKLPTTSEYDLAEKEWRFQCLSSSRVDRIVTVPTTGTHGKSKRLSFTDEDVRRAVDFIYRGYLTMNCERGEKMLVMMSGTTPGSIGDLVIRAMKPLKMGVQVYGTVTDIRDAYEKIMEFKPAVIEGVPWQTAAIARYGCRYGNPEAEFIRSVNLSADLVPDSICSRLKRLWKCTVHRHYGMTEMCIFGGVECAGQKGYHMRSCDLLFEIPETDEEGYGEVLITTLDREAMPLIRYRTGDIGRLAKAACACGSDLIRIEKLCGRLSNLVTVEGRSCFFSEFADAVYRQDAVIDFDLTVREPALTLTVRTLPGEHLTEADIRRELAAVPSVARVVGGMEALKIVFEETEFFPSGYNLKKRVLH